MGFSTFSGPLRAGTVREGAGVNTGVALLTQSATISFTDTSAKDLFTIPAGSQILNIAVYVTEAFDAGTNNVVNVRNGTTVIAAATATGAPLAVGFEGLPVDAQVGFYANVGTSDVTLNGIFAPTGTAATEGEATVVILYAQRAKDGSQNPTYA